MSIALDSVNGLARGELLDFAHPTPRRHSVAGGARDFHPVIPLLYHGLNYLLLRFSVFVQQILRESWFFVKSIW
jgi:hypothetical protein